MLLYTLFSLSILLLQGKIVASIVASDHDGEDTARARYYGPYALVWNETQCPIISSVSHKSVSDCEDMCDTTENCTAFCFNEEDQCELKACELPVPQPIKKNTPWVGYSRTRVAYWFESSTPRPTIDTRIIKQNITDEGSEISTTNATNEPTTISENENEGDHPRYLPEPDCISVMLLVALPITHEHSASYHLSQTHAYVRRCMGAFTKKKACFCQDQMQHMEHWDLTMIDTGNGKEDVIHLNWVSHDECHYQRRKCPIEDSLECYKKRNTHYYDEANCKCDCIIQIDGKDTCLDTTIDAYIAASMTQVNVATGGSHVWIPVLTFILGVLACAAILYFRKYRNRKAQSVNEATPLTGISNSGNDEEETVK